MRENRGPWYLLTGLLLGLIFGLVYAWRIEPLRYIDALPHNLNPAAKNQYRVMIALAYQADANLGRARQRLALLNDSSPAQALAAQAQQSASPASSDARALATLAEAYNPRATTIPAAATLAPTPSPSALPSRAPTGQLSVTPTLDPALAVRTATLPPTATATITPTITVTLAATLTPRPTLRPSPTPGAPFAFRDKQAVCDPNLPALLQVEVFNSANQPVGGVAVRVAWPPAGSDLFYTGLNPAISPGYADFRMEPRIVYTLKAGENGEAVGNLMTHDCVQIDGSGTYQGGWKVNFVQP